MFSVAYTFGSEEMGRTDFLCIRPLDGFTNGAIIDPRECFPCSGRNVAFEPELCGALG